MNYFTEVMDIEGINENIGESVKPVDCLPAYHLYMIQLIDESFTTDSKSVTRYFIHVERGNDDHSKIMTNCALLYDYVYKYRPVKIVDVIPNIEFVQIDRIVLEYMHKYGVENVRGGSYSSEVLPDYVLKTLYLQLNTMTIGPIHLQNHIESTNNLKMDKNKYEKLKSQYNSLKYFMHENVKYVMDHEYFENELKWLYQHIDKTVHNVNHNILIKDAALKKIIHQKYSQLMVYVKQLPRMYETVCKYRYMDVNENPFLQNINNVFLKHPEFVFDNFIYHSHNLRSRNIDETEWTDLHEKISYMFAFVINYLDEIEFDLFAPIKFSPQ